MTRQTLLCIVALPPPVTGSATASRMVVDYLKRYFDVTVVEYQRGSLESGTFELRQALRITGRGIRLRLIRKRFTKCYMVISSSFWGNLRDMFFLLMIGPDLRKNTVLHYHGGTMDKYLHGSLRIFKWLNKKLLSQTRKTIVLGESLNGLFEGYVENARIAVVKNCFDSQLLIPDEMFRKKLRSPEKVNILFLSNLIYEKGYTLLLDAFLSLPPLLGATACLHIAGSPSCNEELVLFLRRIDGVPNVVYHGVVAGERKRDLLWSSHIFVSRLSTGTKGSPYRYWSRMPPVASH